MDEATTMIEALKIGGVPGMLVVVLGALIRSWLATMKADAEKRTDQLFKLLGEMKSEIDQIKSELIADLRVKVARLEARVGSRRAEDSQT